MIGIIIPCKGNKLFNLVSFLYYITIYIMQLLTTYDYHNQVSK